MNLLCYQLLNLRNYQSNFAGNHALVDMSDRHLYLTEVSGDSSPIMQVVFTQFLLENEWK